MLARFIIFYLTFLIFCVILLSEVLNGLEMEVVREKMACKLAIADYTLFYLDGGKRFPQSIPRNGDTGGELSSPFFITGGIQ